MLIEELIEVVVFLNLILAFMVFVEDLYFYFKVKEDTGWSKILYAGVGLAWVIRYILYYIQLHPFDRGDVNVPVLILSTFTLLSMTVGANIRIQRDVGAGVVVKDFKQFPNRIIENIKQIPNRIRKGIVKWICHQ